MGRDRKKLVSDTKAISEILAPSALDILQACVGLAKELSIIPQWYGSKRNYIYRINSPLRKKIYKHIKTYPLKGVGFVFGTETLGGDNNYFIGLDGFVSLHNIIKHNPGAKMGDAPLGAICQDFVDYLEDSSFRDIDKIESCGKKLFDFLINNCNNLNFANMLIRPNCEYAKVYKNLYAVAREEEEAYARAVLKRFLKASFKGIYVSGKQFDKVEFGGRFAEIVLNLQERGVRGKKLKEHVCEEVKTEGTEAVEIKENIGILGKLYKLLPRPEEKKVEKRADPLTTPTLVVTLSKRIEQYEHIFNIFEEDMRHYDANFKKVGERLPIIVSFYRYTDKSRLNNMCMGYNKDTKYRIQQIRFIRGEKFEKAYDRYEKLIEKYNILE